MQAATKREIIDQLQKDLLLLQGYSPPSAHPVDVGLGPVVTAFPNAVFPVGAMHEFLSDTTEHTAATGGFIAGLLASLMRQGGVCVWISASRTVFPPALSTFGVSPDRIIFIDLEREKDVLWAMEEALKCEGLAAVIGEIRDISLTSSRRFQLAVEQSRVTGFMLRHQPRDRNAIACIARWRITPIASEPVDGMPGVGFPRWKVELLKARNGRPGVWQLEWAAGQFRTVDEKIVKRGAVIRKTG